MWLLCFSLSPKAPKNNKFYLNVILNALCLIKSNCTGSIAQHMCYMFCLNRQPLRKKVCWELETVICVTGDCYIRSVLCKFSLLLALYCIDCFSFFNPSLSTCASWVPLYKAQLSVCKSVYDVKKANFSALCRNKL